MPGEIGETPTAQEPLRSFEKRLSLEEARLGALSSELLSRLQSPECSPEIARRFVVAEILLPAEEMRTAPLPWVVDSVLQVIARRALADVTASWVVEGAQAEISGINKKISELMACQKEEVTSEERKRLREEIESLRKQREWYERIQENEQALAQETEKWKEVLEEIKAAFALRRLCFEVERLERDVRKFAETLVGFEEAITPSQIVTLLEIPGVGRAVERALERIIDIHLGLVPKRDCPPILQEKRPYRKERERFLEYLEQHCAPDSELLTRKWEALLACSLATVTLLAVWLGSFPEEKIGVKGMCTFFGRSQSDLVKLVYFGKTTRQAIKNNYPGGPPVQLPALPECLTKSFFHFAQVKVTRDSEGFIETVDSVDAPRGEEISVFDAWYKENKRREEAGREKIRLAEILRHLPEDSYGYWLYCIFRQEEVREALLVNDGVEVVERFMSLEKVRALNKAFNVAFGDRVEKREFTKVCLVAASIIAWREPSVRQWRERAVSEIVREEGVTTTGIGYIKAGCINGGLLTPEEWKLVEIMLRADRVLTLEELKEREPTASEILLGEKTDGIKRVGGHQSF